MGGLYYVSNLSLKTAVLYIALKDEICHHGSQQEVGLYGATHTRADTSPAKPVYLHTYIYIHIYILI